MAAKLVGNALHLVTSLVYHNFMNKNLTQLKKKLGDEKRLLEKELSAIGVRDPRNPENWEAREEKNEYTEDPNVAADVIEETEKHHALTDTLEIRLRNVVTALKRIEEGTYGICSIGGEQIEQERLEANPAAITCKKHLE